MSSATRFHDGRPPAYAGLGDADYPGAGWFDWAEAPRSADAGVPDAVRAAVSRALAGAGAVTFLVGEPHPSMQVIDVRRSALAELFGRPLRQGTTREPAGVELLFDDPLQAWWLGSAVALVSDPGGPPPLPDAATWKALAGDGWVDAARAEPRVAAAVRAGVDGELAGWWSRDAALRNAFAQALSEGAA